MSPITRAAKGDGRMKFSVMKSAGASIRTALIALAVAAPLVGCATASGPTFQAAAIPANQGMVYVFRPFGVVASGQELRVAIDGKYAGDLLNGGYLPIAL